MTFPIKTSSRKLKRNIAKTHKKSIRKLSSVANLGSQAKNLNYGFQKSPQPSPDQPSGVGPTGKGETPRGPGLKGCWQFKLPRTSKTRRALASQTPPDPFWMHLGTILDPIWDQLGPSWPILKRSWPVLGPTWINLASNFIPKCVPKNFCFKF